MLTVGSHQNSDPRRLRILPVLALLVLATGCAVSTGPESGASTATELVQPGNKIRTTEDLLREQARSCPVGTKAWCDNHVSAASCKCVNESRFRSKLTRIFKQ